MSNYTITRATDANDRRVLEATCRGCRATWLSSQAVSQPISVRRIAEEFCRVLGLPPRLVMCLLVEPGQVTAEVMHLEDGIPHILKDDGRTELCTGETLTMAAGRWEPVTAACGATFEIPDTEH